MEIKYNEYNNEILIKIERINSKAFDFKEASELYVEISQRPEDYFNLSFVSINDKEITTNDLILRKDWGNIVKKISLFIDEYLKKERDFMKHHYLGHLKDYENSDSSFERRNIDDYPVLVHTFLDKTGEEIELRQSGEELKYVKKGSDGALLYEEGDEFGKKEIVYLTQEEIIEKGLPLHDTSVLAFDSKGNNVGLACDEWGVDGIWVKNSHQRRGIGLVLIKQFRSQFPEDRKHGQMTDSGIAFAKAYFREKTK